MGYRIRAVHTREFQQVYALLERAFPDADPRMFIAQTECDRTFRLRHGRAAVDGDGRIIGWVRIFSRRMTVRGVPTAAGGIGQVAVDPAARHAGIALALLQDAVGVMRAEGMALSFLFTGIPALYERAGFRVVPEPFFEFDAREAAGLPGGDEYDVQPLASAVVASCDGVARSAAGAGVTGRIVRRRPPRGAPWDEQRWLGEDGAGCLIATPRDEPAVRAAGYIRCAVRGRQYQVLEAECLPDHPAAMQPLLRAAARRALALAPAGAATARMGALAPDASRLAAVLRGIRSTAETTDVAHPMMMRALTGDPGIEAAIFHDPIYFWNTARI